MRWDSNTTRLEHSLKRSREALNARLELLKKKEARFEARTHQLEEAQAALDSRVQVAAWKAVEKLQTEHRAGIQRIADWAGEASMALVPLGMSLIQVA
jgi:hypothetical protein